MSSWRRPASLRSLGMTNSKDPSCKQVRMVPQQPQGDDRGPRSKAGARSSVKSKPSPEPSDPNRLTDQTSAAKTGCETPLIISKSFDVGNSKFSHRREIHVLADHGNSHLSALKSLQRGLLVLLDVKKSVEPGNLENFENVFVDIAHHQFAVFRLHFFIKRNEFAESCTREILDISEVQQYFLAVILIDKTKQVFADFLNVLLIKNLAVDEIDDGDFTIILDFQSAAA